MDFHPGNWTDPREWQLQQRRVGGEAIIVLLDTAMGRFHHVAWPIGSQVQGVVRTRAAGALVVAPAAMVAVAGVTTVVLATPRWGLLLRLLLRYGIWRVDQIGRAHV